MTLHAWTQLVASDLQAAQASGMPQLWHTEFKTTELAEVLREISALCPSNGIWNVGDTPPPRPDIVEPARVCLVTCERKGVRYVTKAQFHFGHARWFFDDPPGNPVKIVAWMDAPPPYVADVLGEKISASESETAPAAPTAALS